MVSKGFAPRLALRLVLLFAAITVLSLALTNNGYHALTLLAALTTAALAYELHRFVNRTNEELARFLAAARYDDFGRRFESPGAGAGFEGLSRAFDDIMRSFKESRRSQEEQLRHLKALTEHIPVPLLSLFPDGRIQLRNNAARRLFSGVVVNHLRDLQAFGDDAPEVFADLEPGRRALIDFSLDGMERRLTAVMTRVVTGDVSEKLISLQDIQSELDDVQLEAWEELVRVLTHEIMNSITPVSSLARTATDLVEDLREKLTAAGVMNEAAEELEDVGRAVDTVARRSRGLMQFVESYRSLTLLPVPRKRELSLDQVLSGVRELIKEEWARKAIALEINLEPSRLPLSADPDLLEQLLINLLRNAEQALDGRETPRVLITGRLNRRGRVLLEIADNGSGIPVDIRRRIFTPFFTTKPRGSGVGLAVSRQIMLAHGGSISVNESPLGGAMFTLIF